MNAPPDYAVEIPWIGPIVGHLEPGAGSLPVGVQSDPVLGSALAAVFIAVRREGKALTVLDVNGLPAIWAAPYKGNDEGRACIGVPLELWQDGASGVLVLLVYDRSVVPGAPLFPLSWGDHVRSLAAGPLDLDASALNLVERLPAPVRSRILARVHDFIAQAGHDLALALIERSAPAPEKLCFAVASCQYAAGFLDRGLAEASYARLALELDHATPDTWPRALLLVGDQVYVDPSAGLFDPTALYDRFRFPHERLLRLRAVRRVLRRVPLYAMLDDHELVDNWEPVPGRGEDPVLLEGRRAYLDYQRLAGPPPRAPEADSAVPLWYEFRLDGFPFFVADTRTERDPRRAETIDGAHIMKPTQFRALLRWLREPVYADLPKFVATSAALLPRHRRASVSAAAALRADGWDGYPASFYRLLAGLVEGSVRHAVFFSGDEHLSFVCQARVWREGKEPVRLHSIHSSALYAPFPFANAIAADLAEHETFGFELRWNKDDPPRRYYCEVETTHFAAGGDGFTLLHAEQRGGAWQLDWRFVPAGGAKAETMTLAL